MGALATVLFFLIIAAFIFHIFTLGDFYIEFDGKSYWVWQKEFLGYDRCRGHFYEEAEARSRIETMKRNPPRTIKP